MAKNRISNEVGATVFAVLSALAVLFLMAWSFGTGGCSKTSRGITIAEHDGLSVDDVSAQLSKSRIDLVEESARRAELALQSDKWKSAKIDTEKKLDDLQLQYDALNLKFGKLNLAASLKKVESDQMEVDGALVAKLQNELGQLRASSSNKAKEAQLSVTTLGDANKKLLLQLDALKKMSAGNKPQPELTKLDAANKTLAVELAALKKLSAQKEKDCKVAIAKLTAANKTLTIKLAALKKGKSAAIVYPALDMPLLINDPSKLNVSFGSVFTRLRGIEDTPAAREKAMAAIAKEGKANAGCIVHFNSGSADPQGTELKTLEELIKNSKKGEKYFVVGYASKDGDHAANRKLSSQRASSVAQKIVSAGKVGKADVQAVYFGETSRFDASSNPPNRVVEVWRVK